jgi:hypothetical protein
MTRTAGLTGTAGEYYVAAELSLRGWLATPTIKNSPGTDVLAQYRERGILVAIQTKTASLNNEFMLNAGIEKPSFAENEWVVLVKLHGLVARPSFFVIPHNHVAAAAYARHKRSMPTPGRGGEPRRDTKIRMLIAKQFAGYEDRWDLLLQPTSEVPNLLAADYAEYVALWGFPTCTPGCRRGLRTRVRDCFVRSGPVGDDFRGDARCSGC